MTDNVNRPAHYLSATIECIEAIEAQMTPEEFRGYLKGNIAKYLWRERRKGGLESIQKAAWYIDLLARRTPEQKQNPQEQDND